VAVIPFPPIPDPDPAELLNHSLDEIAELAAVIKLDRDIRNIATELTRDEARLLVGLYYDLQERRLGLRNQERELGEAGRSVKIFTHFAAQTSTLEKQAQSILNVYSTATEVGRWSRRVVGIGPVIAAGLHAHIDITKAPTVGHIWRFAGLDPTVIWAKGQKRPWNADLKVLCWKIGDSFVKVSGRDDAVYGQVYKDRKVYELERDARGGNAEAAATSLATRSIKDKKLRTTYESGHLPPGRLDLRARRYATKLFLSHWHEVAYRAEYGEAPPLPYPIAQLGHAHKVDPPHLDE
jgi:hypothetical protein